MHQQILMNSWSYSLVSLFLRHLWNYCTEKNRKTNKQKTSILYSQVHYLQPISSVTLQQISCLKKRKCGIQFSSLPSNKWKCCSKNRLLQLLFAFCCFNCHWFYFTSMLSFCDCRLKVSGTGGKRRKKKKEKHFLNTFLVLSFILNSLYEIHWKYELFSYSFHDANNKQIKLLVGK